MILLSRKSLIKLKLTYFRWNSPHQSITQHLLQMVWLKITVSIQISKKKVKSKLIKNHILAPFFN